MVPPSRSTSRNKNVEIISIPFIKKYIQYAKSRVKPVLTKGAADHIIATYSALRNDDLSGNQRRTSPITPRTLETLIRLSTAHAKARLSNRVDEKDAKHAEAILRFAMFKEVVDDGRRKRRRVATFDEDSDDESDPDLDDDEDEDTTFRGTSTATPGRAGTRSRGAASSTVPDDDPDSLYTASPRAQRTRSSQNTRTQTQSESQMSVASSKPASQLVQSQTDDSQSTVSAHPITPARMTVFRQTLGPLLGSRVFADSDMTSVDDLIEAVNTAIRASPTLGAAHIFSRPEAIQALGVMNEENLLM
jgi:DNA replication licensing factor MCM3